MPAYAFLGGAFDPIHRAHIYLLSELAKQLPYDKLFIMPYGVSPTDKKLQANHHHRKAMIMHALKQQPQLALEDRELNDRRPSYSYRTMERLRHHYGPECHLSFVMGEDTYTSLPTWRHWQRLAAVVNFVIVNRPGPATTPNPDLHDWESSRHVPKQQFLSSPAQSCLRLDIPLMDISSSSIRRMIKQGKDPSHLLPQGVWQYIKEEKLYTAVH